MKLENCDWVPSQVVHWLSKKLEEKGVPGASYSHTLLSYLHPYFCPHPVSKDPWLKACLGKETRKLEDFDDSIDSDADFPQENKNIVEDKAIIRKIDDIKLEKQEYHKRAVQCLSSASDKIEELDQLVEELFEILEQALKEEKQTLSLNEESTSLPAYLNKCGRRKFLPSNCFLGREGPKSQLETACSVDPVLFRAAASNNSHGTSVDIRPTVSKYSKVLNLQMNCERNMRDDMLGGGDLPNVPANFSSDTPSSMKEEWEYLAQLVNAQNGTPQQGSGNRLFERDTTIQDPFHHSPGLGLSRLENKLKEPWEDSFHIWKNDNTLNANPTLNEPLQRDFSNAMAKYDSISESLLDDLKEKPSGNRMVQPDLWESERHSFGDLHDPIGSFGMSLSMERNENENLADVREKSVMEPNPQFMMDESFSASEHIRQKTFEDELSKSFRQLGIDIWKERREFGSSDQIPQFPIESNKPENYYSFPAKDANVGRRDLFSKIPRGPVGPYADLNHTETSGFSYVIPQRESQNVRHAHLGRANAFGIEDPYRCKMLEEKENLLTSPRTHFRPITQDSQGSNEEEKEQVQITCEAQTGFHNPEFVFQRTGSGNLILENDMVEGSPRKYMIYKEPQSKFVAVESADVVEASPIAHYDTAACSFVPKFKISNNEKFSQTELPPTNMAASPVNIPPLCKDRREKNMDSIWESNFKENIKKIWNEEDCHSGKEIWEIELENLSAKFGDSSKQWNKKDNLDSRDDSASLKNWFKKRNREGSDVLSRIKFLWPSSIKDNGDSPAEEAEGWNHEEVYLGSSFKNSFLTKKDESKADYYGAISWSNDEEESHDDDPLRSGDALGPKWKPWSSQYKDDVDLAPVGSPATKNEFNVSQDKAGSMEDLEIVEPGWDLNDGFEWDPAMIDEANSGEGEMFCCEVDGQQVMLPVEYLEDDIYDKFFGPAEPKLGGSLPEIPYTETGDAKKMPFKIKRKGSRAAHSNRPCTFYLEGNCLRTDCKFSHDLSSITCRFWEENSCFKAETCPFLHGYPTHRKRNRSEGDQNISDAMSLSKLKEITKGSKSRAIGKSARPPPSSFEIDSEADFPSLGSSYESRTNSLEEISKTIASKSSSVRKTKFVAAPNTFLKQLEVKTKGSSQRRKKSKYDNARSLPPSQAGSEKQLNCDANIFESKITSPKPSCHDDGTLSDF